MEPERRVIFAEPLDLASQDEEEENEEAMAGSDEEDIGDDMPVKKVRKFDDAEMRAARQELLLTRNFKLEREYGPAFTGGAFVLMKDGKHGLALNDGKICLIEVDTAKVLGTLLEENEGVITFALSPNQ